MDTPSRGNLVPQREPNSQEEMLIAAKLGRDVRTVQRAVRGEAGKRTQAAVAAAALEMFGFRIPGAA